MGISLCTGPSEKIRSYRLYCWVRRWDVDGEPVGSSTFAVDVKLVFPGWNTLSVKNTNTQLKYSLY